MMLVRTTSEPIITVSTPSYRQHAMLKWRSLQQKANKERPPSQALSLSPLSKMLPFYSSTSLSPTAASFDSSDSSTSEPAHEPEPEPKLSLEIPTLAVTSPTPSTTPSPPTPGPPEYDDSRHPWSRKKIEPREEEGKESLPAYECTICHMGYLNVKREMDSPLIRSTDRSWKHVYLMVWGTCIKAYKQKPTKSGQKLLWSHSMLDAEASLAKDYTKYHNVVRLQIGNGPTFLLRAITAESATQWIDAAQASANISRDIDARIMPEFAFKRRRRRRQVTASAQSTANHHATTSS